MILNKKVLRITACCLTAALTLDTPVLTYAAIPVAGAPAITSVILDNDDLNSTSAGISQNLADVVSSDRKSVV